METPKPVAWPLIFTYRGTILGQGFVADINLQGRVLACPESDGVWVYGVNPGAIAVSAPTLNATNLELRSALTKLFIDFAGEATSFGAFKIAVERFMSESDEESLAAWRAAREAVKAGQVAVPKDLPRESAEAKHFVSVTQKPVDTLTPRDNPLMQEEASDRVYEMAA